MEWNPLTRRGFLKGSTALGLTAAARPKLAWSTAETKVFKARSYCHFKILDPADRLCATEDDVMSAIFDKLIDYKPSTKWEWELQAASSIEQVDQTHVKFTVRPGIAWTNGFGELTAEDVKYSFERIADPEFKAAYHVDWKSLDHVEITDMYSGVLVLKEPYAPLWTTSLPYGSGLIVSKKAVEQLADKRFTMEPPATSGPYKIKKWDPQVRIVLERNPLWNGPESEFDEIEYISIIDFKTAELGYEAGDIDMTGISQSSVTRYQSSPPPHTKVLVRPSLAYWWLGIQAEHPLYTDGRVRNAVQLAVDVNAVLEAAFFGVAERSTGIVAPGLIGHRGYNLVAKRDVEKAKQLLAEAGYPGGFKTHLETRNSTDFVTAAQVIQANLADVGIECEIIPSEGGMLFEKATHPENWKDMQLMLTRFSMAPDPAWATEWFMPGQIGLWNWERFDNAEYAELHNQALVEQDSDRRHQMYVRMQDIMEESGQYLFLTHGVNAYIYRDTIMPAMRPDAQNFIFRKFKLAPTA